MKDEAIHVNACKLAKDTKVALRIDELKSIAAEIADKEFKTKKKPYSMHNLASFGILY